MARSEYELKDEKARRVVVAGDCSHERQKDEDEKAKRVVAADDGSHE